MSTYADILVLSLSSVFFILILYSSFTTGYSCGFYVLFNAYYLFKFSPRSLILPLWFLSILITIILNSATGILVAFISCISFHSFGGEFLFFFCLGHFSLSPYLDSVC